jgi:hypothetical protein
VTPEEIDRSRTAYWALVDRLDQLVGEVCRYMTQPLVELYGGCVVVLNVS